MRIALVAPLVERTPPLRYGGTERVVANLANGLVDRGHEVTLFATGDSETKARLVAAVNHAIWHDLDFQGEPGWPVARQLAQIMARQHDFDIVHSHADYALFPLLYSLEVMCITTMHARLDLTTYREMLREYPFAPLVSISDAQREGVADLNCRWLATVHHGISSEFVAQSEGTGDYLLFLGRMSPEKGPDAAIRIARQAGIPLKMAAKIPEPDRHFYESEVLPLLREPGVEFLGEVSDTDKGRLLAGARALLAPVQWPEPFGLALIEAMACGCPVLALRRGAIPEIVIDGVTGFVRDSIGELAIACGDLDTLSRSACRQRFMQEYTVDRMVDRYLAVYHNAISEEPLPRDAFLGMSPLPTP